jgi:[acyl-carrier-protein] S-malonyltransferase
MLMKGMSDLRIVRAAARGAAALRLFSYPYAGVRALAFCIWQPHLRETMDPIAFHPTGRKDRLRETPVDAVDGLTDAALEAFESWIYRFALFGRSLRVIVASEYTRIWRTQGGAPAHFLFSARSPDRRVLMFKGDHFLHRPNRLAQLPIIVAAREPIVAVTGRPNPVAK